MNVREALIRDVGESSCHHSSMNDSCHNCSAWLGAIAMAERLTPKIEAALRAAWVQGGEDEMRMYQGHHGDFNSDNGVTAGIEAMQ